MRVKSYEPALRKKVWLGLGRNLTNMVHQYVEAVKDKINIQGPPRSLPGDPPHMDTTALYEGFGSEIDLANLEATAGADVPYAVDLEFGTAWMAPRPFIRETLIEESAAMAKEGSRPL